MTDRTQLTSYQFWYVCEDCVRVMIRHANARRCQHCNGKLSRVRKATSEEVQSQVDEALRKHREIPE